MAVIINLFNVFACSLYDRCSRNMYDDLSLLLCLALPNDSQSRLLLPHMHIEEMLFLTVLGVSAAFLQQGFVSFTLVYMYVYTTPTPLFRFLRNFPARTTSNTAIANLNA